MEITKAAGNTVLIAGGGLAGLALGVALTKRGVPVELHERGRYPRHRVCGEFVCGVSEATLNHLGVETFFEKADRLQSTVWFWRERAVLRRQLPRAAYGLSRHGLDLALAEEVRRNGGRVEEKSSYRSGPLEGLVLATGRRAERGGFLGFKAHLRGLQRAADLEVHLGRGGYVGLSPVEDGWVNVCGLFTPVDGLRAGRQDALTMYCRAAGLPGLAERIAHAEWAENSPQGIAGVVCGPVPPDPAQPMVRIGDAWGVTPPFTGNGMSIALESAALAVEPVAEWSRGRLPWPACVARVEQACQHAFSRRLRVAGWMHPWLLRPQRQKILIPLAQRGLVPFDTFFRWSH